MNYETIQSFLQFPKQNTARDEEATVQAKDTLKKYESFKELLDGRLDLFTQCEQLCSLELLDQLPTTTDMVDKNFILGFKFGIRSLLDNYNKYQEARRYLYENKERN